MLPNGGAFCAPVKTQLGIDVKQQYHILVTWSILRSPYKVFRVQFSIPYFIIAEFASTLPCLSRDRKPVNYRRARAAFWDGSVAVQNRIHSSKTYSKNNRGETSLCILFPPPRPPSLAAQHELWWDSRWIKETFPRLSHLIRRGQKRIHTTFLKLGEVFQVVCFSFASLINSHVL